MKTSSAYSLAIAVALLCGASTALWLKVWANFDFHAPPQQTLLLVGSSFGFVGSATIAAILRSHLTLQERIERLEAHLSLPPPE